MPGNAPSTVPTAEPHGEYLRRDVLRMLDVSEKRLRAWEQQGLIPGGDSFAFHDLLAMRALKKLSENKIPPRQIRLALESLKRKLTDIQEPLRELRIVSDGKRISVQVGGQKMEAISGQLLFNFDPSEIPEVRSLSQAAPKPAPSTEPDPAEAAEEWFQKGLALEESGAAPDQAHAAYSRAVELNPNAAGALVNLGTIAFRARRLRDAAAYYTRAIDADPRYPLAHFNLGNIFDELGQIDEARRQYELALRLNPDYGDAIFNLALIAERKSENMQAVRYWKAYLKLDATSTWAAQARKQLERLRKLTVVE